MRRLAVQSREDTYKSFRDYQQLIGRASARISLCSSSAGEANNIVSVQFDAPGPVQAGDVIVLGGYFSAACSSTIAVNVTQGNFIISQDNSVQVDVNWRRFGIVGTSISSEPIRVQILLDGRIPLDVWGLACGKPRLPTRNDLAISEEDINLQHLIPETFYLEHDQAVGLKIYTASKNFSISEGRQITVKKCSYCGRLLPVEVERPGVLSFHKHNAKVSGHQNECRACKKWRINDQFNPIRTADQLHESSVITRERKLLLREPEKLKAIKERSGRGLRSQVWDRFNHKCFKCGIEVALDEFQLDHTRPLAYLWPIDEFATCLCARCNNEKKEKFPIDFYTADELDALSRITGIDRVELNRKAINEVELTRIIKNLREFARVWEARTFFAINRKVNELMPHIDLLNHLAKIDFDQYQRLCYEYSNRPMEFDEEE